jgi:hypothetical protein
MNFTQIVKILAVNLFREFFRLSDSLRCFKKLFRKPPVILKIVQKAGDECIHLKKSTKECEGKPEKKFDAASEQFLELLRKKQAKT